tara:strand:+ start:1330 stop:2010 length:681 start_codon:yes stop_codon:yes gene_type:complete
MVKNYTKNLLRRIKRLYIRNCLRVKKIITKDLSLSESYNLNDIWINEGNINQIPKQVELIKKIIKGGNINSVLEIGFNAGYSAELFLNNTSMDIVSFDDGRHEYHKFGKLHIDKNFPNRHSLILGDSKKTLLEYIISNPTKNFDLIFIDGGHDYNTAESDLLNCKNLSHKNTIVIMDDTVYKKEMICEWNIGPTNVWKKAVEKKIIKEISKIEFDRGRGMSWGRYS